MNYSKIGLRYAVSCFKIIDLHLVEWLHELAPSGTAA